MGSSSKVSLALVALVGLCFLLRCDPAVGKSILLRDDGDEHYKEQGTGLGVRQKRAPGKPSICPLYVLVTPEEEEPPVVERLRAVARHEDDLSNMTLKQRLRKYLVDLHVESILRTARRAFYLKQSEQKLRQAAAAQQQQQVAY